MDNNYTHSDLLIQYLDGELTAEGRLQLENELKQNSALQQELARLQLAKDAIKSYGLRQRVATIHQEMKRELAVEKKLVRSNWKRRVRVGMRVAASILVVLLGIGVYQYATVSADKLFAENYQPYTLSVSRGAAETSAMEKAYHEKNYTAVIGQFTNLPSSNQKENFLAGQAYLAIQDYLKAISCFNKIASLNTEGHTAFFKDDAEYYLALGYLKNNELTAADSLFTTIHNNSGHLYNDKVTGAFLRKLKLLSWKK
jgi:tetratricopeptide (TPR) repeat protein